MARSQTYIIDKENKIYSYSSDSHPDNHQEHFNIHYNIQINEYIPFVLMKNNNCIIDLVRHSKIGVIYLPLDLTEYQRQWLLEREKAFQKIEWQLCTNRIYGIENFDNVRFDQVKEEVIQKRII